MHCAVPITSRLGRFYLITHGPLGWDRGGVQFLLLAGWTDFFTLITPGTLGWDRGGEQFLLLPAVAGWADFTLTNN